MESRLQLGDFGLFRCEPAVTPKAGIVVVQEIFGLNSHIRDVCRRWASFGYDVAAPALFDPIEKNVELGYDAESKAKGVELMKRSGLERPLEGVQRAIDFLAHENQRVFVIGYCWGGTLAFLAAARLRGVEKAVAYYGRLIVDHAQEKPKKPVLYHYGKFDPSIPPENVEKVRAARPEGEIFVYEAGHGFNCDQRADYDEKAARLAEERTLAFLARSD